MVLGRGFESRLHLKTRWKDGPLDGRKSNENIKGAKWSQPHQKIFFFKEGNLYFEPEKTTEPTSQLVKMNIISLNINCAQLH